MPAAPPLHFRPRHRLAHARQFQAVYGARVRKTRGPLTVFALPNGLTHYRLGLAVGRRCGAATVRNTIKRRIREAFRLLQHDLPSAPEGHGYDLVVSVAPHEPVETARYGDLLAWCCARLDGEHRKRRDPGTGA
jgi:ribonuclease P protein component